MFHHKTLPDSGFLRAKQIIQFIPIAECTWWRWVAVGKAPPPIKLGPKTTVWRAEDIRAFIEEDSHE